jgi:hypothetical protein
MKHTLGRRLLSLVAITSLLTLDLPAAAFGQSPPGAPDPEDVAAAGEPTPDALLLPGRRVSVRDSPATEDQRIISLDARVEPPVLGRSSGWKWLAIGAGVAGAVAATFLATGNGGVSVPLPTPGGTAVPIPVPVPLATPTLAPSDAPADPADAEPTGNRNGEDKASRKGNGNGMGNGNR